MTIKVVVNYPEDPKGMEELKNRQAEAVLICLKNKLGTERLDKLMNCLRAEYQNN